MSVHEKIQNNVDFYREVNHVTGKKPVTLEDYCAKNLWNKPRENMDRCSIRHNTIEILLRIVVSLLSQMT